MRKKQAEAVWQRFRAACDRFFERYKNRDALERRPSLAEREATLRRAGSDAGRRPGEARARRSLRQDVQALQARWRQAPRLSAEEDGRAGAPLPELRARLIAARSDAFRGSELDPELIRARKEKLCARVEPLVARLASRPSAGLSGEALARRLKEAAGRQHDRRRRPGRGAPARRAEEVEAARAAWSRLPALIGEAGEALEALPRGLRSFRRERPAPAPDAARAKPRTRPARPGCCRVTPRDRQCSGVVRSYRGDDMRMRIAVFGAAGSAATSGAASPRPVIPSSSSRAARTWRRCAADGLAVGEHRR